MLQRKRVRMSFGVDFRCRGIQQLVLVAPVEDYKTDSSDAENERRDTGVNDRCDRSVTGLL